MPENVGNWKQEEFRSPALEWLGWGLVALLWGLSAFAYYRLPDIIPIHFDSSGAIDRHGSKLTIWLLPFIATAVYSGLSFLCRYPGIFNYPVPITDENRLFQYSNAVRFLQVLNLAILVVFILVTCLVYRAASGAMNQAPAWLLPLILCLVVLPSVFMIVRAFRNKGSGSR